MNKKTILIVFLASTVFYISSMVATLWGAWSLVIYKITYYGSLPWSLPWFTPPLQACLECGASKMAHYVGFVINVFLIFMLVRFFVRLAPIIHRQDEPLSLAKKEEFTNELSKSACWFVYESGWEEMPSSILGITLGWHWTNNTELDIKIRTYFDAKPNENELDYIEELAGYLISGLWFRINELKTENIVSNKASSIEPLNYLVFSRD